MTWPVCTEPARLALPHLQSCTPTPPPAPHAPTQPPPSNLTISQHTPGQITSDDSDLGALRINPTAMSALSLNSTMLASAALVNASSAVAADALTGDTPAPCSREAYLQARTLVAHSLPALSLLRTADNGSALIEMLVGAEASQEYWGVDHEW